MTTLSVKSVLPVEARKSEAGREESALVGWAEFKTGVSEGDGTVLSVVEEGYSHLPAA